MKRLMITLSAGWLALPTGLLLGQEMLPAPKPPEPIVAAETAPAVQRLQLADLIQISLERNPALQQAVLEIAAAQGRALQAGLHPNPTVSVIGEELGGRDGPGGFITAPMVSQEIVTGGKLRLSRAAAVSKIDQASLGLVRQRFTLFTTVRQGYFEVLAARQRVVILQELLQVAAESYKKTSQLLEAKQLAELDLLPFQVERERFQVDLAAAQRDQEAAWRRLTASMGAPELPFTDLTGKLDDELPVYDFEQSKACVLQEHPDIYIARAGIRRAETTLRREQVERIPNVTVAGGYTRDNIGRQNEWTFQVGLPVPLFNRNQGNIAAASAELGQANQQVGIAENLLIGQLASAYGDYSSARERVMRYRTTIRPVAERTYKLSLEAFKGGQFEYLRVLQAQRSLAEANLEYNRALLEAWRAASNIAGLLLEEHWPPQPAPVEGVPAK